MTTSKRAACARSGLGDMVWEYRWKSYEPAEWQFADVTYPAQPVIDTPCDSIHGTCMIVENGAPLVRRSAREPWLPLDTVGNELLRARTLRLRATAHRADDPAALRWIERSLDDLPEALAWCQAAMRADGGSPPEPPVCGTGDEWASRPNPSPAVATRRNRSLREQVEGRGR